MTERPKLGVVAISRNEEQDMPAFLAHLLLWVDEIVIIDDGSTDRTADIARDAGSKVVFIEQTQDSIHGFAGQRNRGIETAKSDWLLHMDIDERVPPELAREIHEAICDESKKAYRYHRLNFFLHRPMKGGGWQKWNKPQLARRGKHHFENRVHEECVVEGPVGQLQASMWHLNDQDYSERLRKSIQYSTIEAEKLCAKDHRIRWIDFILPPIIAFVRKFVFQRGYQDGTLGLISAIHGADAVFRTYVLAWDMQNRRSRQDLENDLVQRWQREVDV